MNQNDQASKTTHDYSIKKEGDYLTLLKDGNPCLCPKSVVAVPVQTAMGAMAVGLQRVPCTTACPHANIFEEKEDEKEKLVYRITCESQKLSFDLLEADEAPKQKSKLVSI